MQPTGNLIPCYLYSKCHPICHSGEQATHQHSNECSRKDTPGCHNTLQHHTFTVQQPELPADCTSCSIHSSKSQRLPILYETSHHTYNGWCRHTWNTLTSCTICGGSQKMLLHIKETLPSTMHLPISSEDALHFYRYLCNHILIADEQFLLLTDVTIQDCAQQLEIYEVFNLAIPHRNFSACYNINNRYLGIMHDKTKAVPISENQFKTYQKAYRQFCSLNTPLLLPTNPPSCVSALYSKDKASIEKRCSL